MLSAAAHMDGLGKDPTDRVARMTETLKVFLAALVVTVLAIACGPNGGAQPVGRDDAMPATTRVWPDSWPVPPLPVMWLVHPSESIWGSPHSYCWHLDQDSDRVCQEYDIWSGVNAYPEAVPGKQIRVRIESETLPDNVFAQVFTRHGNLMVDFLRLGPSYPVLDLDLAPGDYHIRVIGQWQYNDATAYLDRRYNGVAYEFGLHVPGAVELIGGCDTTEIGGDLSIVLNSLDDRLRTASDSANRAGCRFNKPIARVSLTLDNGRPDVYGRFPHRPAGADRRLPAARRSGLGEERRPAAARRILTPDGRDYRGRRRVRHHQPRRVPHDHHRSRTLTPQSVAQAKGWAGRANYGNGAHCCARFAPGLPGREGADPGGEDQCDLVGPYASPPSRIPK